MRAPRAGAGVPGSRFAVWVPVSRFAVSVPGSRFAVSVPVSRPSPARSAWVVVVAVCGRKIHVARSPAAKANTAVPITEFGMPNSRCPCQDCSESLHPISGFKSQLSAAWGFFRVFSSLKTSSILASIPMIAQVKRKMLVDN